MGTHHLAQCNIARLRAPLESPMLTGFVAALEPINRLADGAPGFVWRLQTEEGDATGFRPFDDGLMLVNMSVWESLASLASFAYGNPHREIMRHRREWFERMVDAYLVLWWIPAGTLPTVEEAKDRLEMLRSIGPSPRAFTFRSPFGPEAQPSLRPAPVDDAWLCPT